MRLLIRIGTLDTITLWRVRKQIEDTAPDWIEFTKNENLADAQIILAIGANGMAELVEKMPTVILQLCYKTAHGGSVEFWDELWSKCLMVASYFNLDAPNFVRFPMGYDPEMFYRDDKAKKRYDAIVFGEVDGPEEIKSVVDTFDVVAHISGTDMGFGAGYVNYNNIPDDRLRGIYQQSKYCIGLRHTEGFEMPIVEGAACGCIPITFDLECYWHWFGDFAVLLDPSEDIKDQLRLVKGTDIYPAPTDRVAKFEQQIAWKPFWDKLADLFSQGSHVYFSQPDEPSENGRPSLTEMLKNFSVMVKDYYTFRQDDDLKADIEALYQKILPRLAEDDPRRRSLDSLKELAEVKDE